MVSHSTTEPLGLITSDGVETPLFVRIARLIEDDIVAGRLGADEQAPSTNEIAAFHAVNPATALKGVAQLAADGILYKRRGIGMFVASDARERLLTRRRAEYPARFLDPALTEAERLGLSPADVIDLITRRNSDA